MEAQLLSQLYNAIIAAIIVVLGGMAVLIVAWFKFIPQRMAARLEEYKANEATRREIAKDKSDTIRETEQADNKLKLAMAQTLTEQIPMWQRILEEFRDTRSATESHTIATSNTARAVEANGRQITGLTEEISVLREKAESTYVKVTELVDKLPSNTAQIESSINTLTDIAKNITSAQVDLNLLMNKVTDATQRLVLKKTDSQPIHIPKELLDTAGDGKPQA